MRHLKKFEKTPKKSIKNRKVDIEDIRYIFDNLLDYGFKVNISIMDSTDATRFAPSRYEILKYCNGYIKISMDMAIPIREYNKKVAIEIDSMLEEINDRLDDSKYLFFNDVSEVNENRWNAVDHDSLKRYLNIHYYLFLEGGFKKGTTFQIPELMKFSTYSGYRRRKL